MASARKTGSPVGLWSSASNVMGTLSSLYGSFSYHDDAKDECEGVNLALLLTTFASVAAVFFSIYTKLTGIIGRRRKRSAPEGSGDALAAVLDHLDLIVREGTTIVKSGRVRCSCVQKGAD